MRSRIHIAEAFLIIIGTIVFSEDYYYRVVRDTPLFIEHCGINKKSYSGTLNVGDKVCLLTHFSLNENEMNGGERVITAHINYEKNNENYGFDVFANDLVPWDAEDNIEAGLLTRFFGSNKRKWVVTELVEIIKQNDRDIFLNTNHYFREIYNPANFDYNSITPWYEYVSFLLKTNQVLYLFISSSSIFTDIGISLKNITQINQGYTLIGATIDEIRSLEENRIGLDWSPIEGKERNFTITLKIDGDFMDIYLEDNPNKFATYQLVDQATIEQIVNLLETETCDLKKVTWPIRASDLGGTGLIYRTVDRLKLRKSENRSSNVIKTLDIGAGMILLAKGSEETIDGITAPWVQVKTETGETGWCFGGYLDPKP